MARHFSELTTMRVGGPTREFVEAPTTEELVEAVRAADARGVRLLVMGGGSNLVVGDGGWDGVTVQVRSNGIDIDGATVRADAGVDWDRLVAVTVEHGLAGLEPLSGVPGTVGGTPVQNVGAFGTVTSDVLASVTVYDRRTGATQEWPRERCGFGSHRQSAFKHTDRYVVLRVTYELRRSDRSVPMTFESLLSRLGIRAGETADVADVRRAVLELRRERGSIVDPADTDTWGVGSFFINPVVANVPKAAEASPRYPDPLGTKLPAGWLIQHAGFPPGYGAEFGSGAVTLSSKHALALCNRGGATTLEVMRFAAHIRAGVHARFGILLGPECHLVNCSFDDELAAR
ncbi:MAG TPA: UDP-N-acetylmuramate dehydrogenase [Jatrophihabitans sp.]|uniref:UDP-N-acetylmuramate dehydrogenase n=1 Tax=Jatrophihabitans sp. TaxID=1932789 RepID=UPI002EEAAB62